MNRPTVCCQYCATRLNRDTVGLNKKLFGRNTPKELLMCLDCMAGILDCTVDDLKAKIEEFKNDGCKLFG
jgi:hypothetical protein